MWAVQFHPEVHHTPLGADILRNFALKICGAQPTWTGQHFIDSTVAAVKPKSATDTRSAHSRVAWTLRSRRCWWIARCVIRPGIAADLRFVNNGVLRKNEFEKVQKNLRDNLGLHLVAVDATDRFMQKLAGVTDPETKAQDHGNEFIAVFDEEAHRVAKTEGKVEWLVPGDALP